MLVKSDIPKLLEAGMRKTFMKEFRKHEAEWERIATRINSTKSEETYPWLGAVPDLHEWVDERVPQGLLEHHFSIRNRSWESSISVDRDALEDEQYGQINIRVRDLANKAGRFWGKMVYTLLNQGDNTTGEDGTILEGKDISCYDGQAFFSDSHEEGESGTQRNGDNLELTADNLQTVIEEMMQWVDDKGNPLEVRPNLLIVNPSQQFTAREILNSQYYPTEVEGTKLATNVLKGALDLYVTPYVDTNFWAVIDTTGIVKPIILQIRRDITFDSLTKDNTDSFLKKKLYFGVDFRGNVGFGMWQYAYGCNPDWSL